MIAYGKVRAERACSVARYLDVHEATNSPTWLDSPNRVNWKLVSDVWINVGCLTLGPLGLQKSIYPVYSPRDPS